VTAGPILAVRELRVAYGEIPAVRGISFDVHEGEIVALIGANGAGKTSTLRAISGLIPYAGQVLFGGRDLRRTASHEIVRSGMAHVPEGRGIFPLLTVAENLRLATWGAKDRAALARATDRVYELFPRLKERLLQQAGTLSGGEQQMLALGRALIASPRVLLLDEPSMGLAPILVRDIFQVLTEINRAGTTIVLIEQHAYMTLRVAHRAHVMETGSIVLSGTGAELLNDARVKSAYLGG
jgi:branched-chain amino acid transport system ATP-binding protein